MEYNIKNIGSIASIFLAPILALLYILIVNPISPDITPVTNSVLGVYISQLQIAEPLWCCVISIVLLFVCGFLAMVATTQYSVYNTASRLPFILYIGFTLTLASTKQLLLSSVISAIMLVSIIELFRAARGRARTSRIFSSAIFIGLLPLFAPTSITLWALYIAALTIYYRPKREIIVATFALLLPASTLCYIRWIGGVDILDSVELLMGGLTTRYGVSWELFTTYSLHNIALFVLLLVSAILSIYGALYIDLLSIKSISRARLLLILIEVLLCFLMLPLPAFTMETLTIFAAPLAVVLPFATLNFKGFKYIAIYLVIAAMMTLRIITA